MITPEDFNECAVTIDLDWAPDFAIRHAARILIEKNIKATWFITHDSPAVRELFDSAGLFEVGIHPNFMSGTSHGATYQEVVAHVLGIYPPAKAVRTHGLFQSSNILRMIAVDHGLRADCSASWQTPCIVPSELLFEDGGDAPARSSYFWAEQEEMMQKEAFHLREDRLSRYVGLKVFSFT